MQIKEAKVIQCKGVWPIFKCEDASGFWIADQHSVFIDKDKSGNMQYYLADDVGLIIESDNEIGLIGFLYGKTKPTNEEVLLYIKEH